MSENPKENPRLEAELAMDDMARAIVDYLVKCRNWPTGVRYEATHLEIKLGGEPHVFTAQIGPLIPR